MQWPAAAGEAFSTAGGGATAPSSLAEQHKLPSAPQWGCPRPHGGMSQRAVKMVPTQVLPLPAPNVPKQPAVPQPVTPTALTPWPRGLFRGSRACLNALAVF